MQYNFHAIVRKDGLLEARYWERYPDGTKKRKSLYGKNKSELKKRYNAACDLAARRESRKSGGVSTSIYLLDWLKNDRTIKDSTRCSYGMVIQKHVLPRIGNKPISSINLCVFQKLVDDILDDGNSARTATLVKWILIKALRKAKKMGLNSYDIIPKDIEIPRHIPEKREIWNLEELKRFLKIIEGDKFEWFYILYTTYGLRRGEAIPLEWKDVNWDNETIIINKQYTRVGKEFKVERPKTEGSIRELPLLPHIRCYLERINPLHDKEGLIASDDEKMANPETVSRHFQKITRDNGLPFVVLHSLRHCVATFLKDVGVPIRDAQTILGHSTSYTTLKFYQHTNTDEAREGLSKYGKLVGF